MNWFYKLFGFSEATTPKSNVSTRYIKFPSSELFLFLQNLSEKGLRSKHFDSWCYKYKVKMFFNENIEVNVEYNNIRNEWEINVWSRETNSFLYRYDGIFSSTPNDAIKFLREKYELDQMIFPAIAKDKQKEQDKHNKINDIKIRILEGK